MKKGSMPEKRMGRVHKRMTGRVCALLIVAMLAGGMPVKIESVSTYAAEATGQGENHDTADGTEDADHGNTQTDGTGSSSGEDYEGGNQTPTMEPPSAGDVPTPIPTPTPAGEPFPTPAVTGSAEPTVTEGVEPTATEEPSPSAAEGAEPTDEPAITEGTEPTAEPEATEGPSPTPTKKPKKTPTPTPESDEATPTPTKKPKKTPTPTPEVTEEPSPTPTKKPNTAVPTGSNDERYQYLLGIDAKELTIDDPPAGYENEAEAAKHMKTITVPVWKMTASGKKYSSSAELTVNKKLAKNVQAIFKEIYALNIKFPIKVVKGYMYRKVGGVGLSKSRLMSIHSFGAAIDINPGDYDNDYFLGKGNDLRDKSNPYCIPDEVIEIFEKYGWFWGGNFEICADTMHFQYFELGMLTYQGNSPFRTLKVKSGYMKGVDVRNLQQRLCELGFTVSIDGVYGNKTSSAVKKYQKSRGLEATGEVNYKTWETIINETHYMAYAF